MTISDPSRREHDPETTTDPRLDVAPWQRLETTIMATARVIREAFDHRLATLDLNLTQASLLAYAADYGPVNQTRLADHLSLGRAATGAAVDRLEERGLVQRTADVDDRRVWMVSATEAGRRMQADVAEIDRVVRAELREGMSRGERQAMVNTLTRLEANAARAASTTSCRTPLSTTNQEQQ